MNNRCLRILEYNKVKERLSNFCQSELGKEKAKELLPFNEIEPIEQALSQTNEAIQLTVKKGMPPLFGIYNLKDVVSLAMKGGILNPKNLLQISDSLRAARQMKEYLNQEEEDIQITSLGATVERLIENRRLEEHINRAILSEDEISDDASDALKSIRRNLRRKSEEIKSKLNQIVSSQAYASLLQDSIVTIREGRYVVPIKSENRSKFPGIVHDHSASGATTFIEPMAIVQLNNDIRLLELKEEEEIKRILKELTQFVAEIGDGISINQDLLQHLDFVFAKGQYSLKIEGIRPTLNRSGVIDLIEARHPLLDERSVVPINFVLGKAHNTIVITGPNTGGKTVTLKTVGLITLMAQSGLNVPCKEQSELSIFDEIYTDIGDEQSIEQSLSTFSSHMTNIVDILKTVHQGSLVLFDELGAGTDPTEGAALAISILKTLLEKKIRTIATTHYSQLKLFALTTEGVVNASVEFDVNTLSPTYRLLIGVPGKSNAFEISKRLGLDHSIIDQAQSLISEENIEFEDILIRIEEDRKAMELAKSESLKSAKEIDELKNRLTHEINRNKKQRDDVIDKAKQEAESIIQEAKDYLDATKKDLDQIKQDRTESSKELGKIRENLRQKEKEYQTNKYAFLNKKTEVIDKAIKAGDEVEVLSLGQSGQVITGPDANGNIVVEIGILKVNSNLDAVRKVAMPSDMKSKSNIKSILKSKSTQNIKSELDIRGMNVEEAILEVDKFIDDAVIVGIKEASIIHGKGTGALREGIKDYLKRHRSVRAQRYGGFSEGGNGVTFIQLK